MQNNFQDTNISIYDLFRELISKWYIIVLAGVLLASIVFINHKVTYDDVYESTASLYINPLTTEDNMPQDSRINVVEDYVQILKSQLVLEEAIESIGEDISYYDLYQSVRISSSEYVLNVSVQNQDAEKAALFSNEIAEAATNVINEMSEIYELKIICRAEQALSYADSGITRKLLIYFFIGVIIAVFSVLTVYFFRNTIKNQNEAENILGLNIIGGICNKEDSSFIVRDILYSEDTIKTIFIANPNKTSNCKTKEKIVSSIANSFEKYGKKTIIVNINYSDALFVDEKNGDHKYDVVYYKEKDENYETILINLRDTYDIIIVYAPSINEDAEAAIISRFCDASIIIVKENKTNRDAAIKAKNQLLHFGPKALGIIYKK